MVLAVLEGRLRLCDDYFLEFRGDSQGTEVCLADKQVVDIPGTGLSWN